MSDAERIAAALRRSPVYVAPSLVSAVPGPERLLDAIRRAPVPVFAVIVPLVSGGEWPDAEHLADDVHRGLGRDGVYLTLDANSAADIRAYEYGVDRDAAEAAGAVDLDRAMDGASLTDRLVRCVQLITSGQAHAAYQRQSDALNRRLRSGSSPRRRREDGAWPYAAGGGAAVLAGTAALLVWRWRRMARVDGGTVPRPAGPSRPAPAELRARATAELLRLGESLEHAQGDSALLQRALDAYAAAGKALDDDRTVAGAAGALVLVGLGREICEAARAGRAPLADPPCFFNPLHGEGDTAVRWRAVGGRERVTVRVCAACAGAVRAREIPDALFDGPVPYYEVDPRRSVWSATGYGQLRDDLVHRVLRGDLTARARNHLDR